MRKAVFCRGFGLTRKAMGAQVQDQGSSQITMAGHTRQMTVRNAL